MRGIELLGTSILVSLALMASATASAAGPVNSHMDGYRVVSSADGTEKLEPVKSVKPGDTIEYQVVYTNEDAKAVSDLQVNVAVPAGTLYVDGSGKTAVKADVLASADGGKTFAAPPLKRARADGKGEEEVPASAYTNLRWQSKEPLVKGSPEKFSYRVKVAEPAVAAVAAKP